MSGRKSQTKGRRAEIELASILNDHGYPVKPGAPANHGTTPDVTGLKGLHIEVKRQEKLNIYEAMAQSIRDSQKFKDGLPAVFFRKNRQDWLVAMRLEDFLAVYETYKP